MSIRKRTWKTAKGEAKEAWVADYVDQAGKRRLKTFKRKKDADAFHSKANVEVSEGVHTADSASTTIGNAADLWLETCRANGLEAATIDAYEQHVRLHLKPFLGRLKLSQLTAPMVRDFEDKLRRGDAAPGEAEGNARSPAMVRRIITSLSTMVGDAQERGLVARNVVKDLRSRRKRGKEKQHESRHNGKLKIGADIPSPEEVKAVLAALDGRWRPILLTATFTGLRASELRGLKWADVDLDKRELHVRQRADKRNVIGPPKSAAGERTIPLPPIVVSALLAHKLASKDRKGLVFGTGAGKPEYHSNIVNRGLIPAWIAAAVTVPVLDEDGKPAKDEEGRAIVAAKYTGLHALRHFYASWLINRKADGGLELPAKTVQERLGHSTIAMTLDTYSHLFPAADAHEELVAAERALLG
ncbi:site-specific integrase [Methylocapsa polymorpha]|uniref:Site-specific integrase n=1 Tax=Methylocapsa polymorpha TaxID=3080828 RepID=A0ABZ0HTV7_9HYPH|nr:site-specific integrase [Methylocapsa sp. RX1]